MEITPFLVSNTIWQVIKIWWWFFLPFILWKPLTFLYLFWLRERWDRKQRKVILEIKIPKESLKPIRAMENVIAGIHQAIYQPADWWENWVEGQIQLSISFEIASIGGETHFYIRTPNSYRDAVEASIYSQYPGVELQKVDDYTKYVPQNIPNKEWNLFAANYKMLKDDHYPFKTYPKFETEHEAKEEKIIDPIAVLLESMSKVKPGEQFWIQITASPLTENPSDHPNAVAWIEAGKALRDKLAKRPEKLGIKPILPEAAKILITGTPSEEKAEERDVIPPEMKLTPGEKDIVTAVEEKLSKPVFSCLVRFIYLGKRDVFFKPNFRLAFNFFGSFATMNLNNIVPDGKTLTKIHKSRLLPVNILNERRLYLRCRKLFRNYVKRLPQFFPRAGGKFVLNTEEIASLFHFPSKLVAPAPGVPHLDVKKGGPPSGLPVE